VLVCHCREDTINALLVMSVANYRPTGTYCLRSIAIEFNDCGVAIDAGVPVNVRRKSKNEIIFNP
jgi:hypothetical protein